jgi:hypothetical protein
MILLVVFFIFFTTKKDYNNYYQGYEYYDVEHSCIGKFKGVLLIASIKIIIFI